MDKQLLRNIINSDGVSERIKAMAVLCYNDVKREVAIHTHSLQLKCEEKDSARLYRSLRHICD